MAANAAVVRASRTVLKLPQFTSYSYGLNLLFGVTAGPDGNVWLTYDGPLEHPGAASGVVRVTPEGAINAMYGSGPADASLPFGIVTGGDGNIWFTDRGNEVIYRIAPDGNMLGAYSEGLSGSDVPAGLTVAADGSLYFISDGLPGPYVGHVDLFGTITEIAHLSSDLLADPSITYSGGNLYFTAVSVPTRHQFLVTIAPDGKPSMLRTGLTGAGAPCNALDNPQSIVTASDGSVWFTNAGYLDHKGNRPIGHLTAAGLHFYNTPIAGMTSVAPGPDGKVWVSGQDAACNGMLGAIGPHGAANVWALPSGTTGSAIAFGPDGNLWMAGTIFIHSGYGGAIIKATP
jgi:streptogramin lyase